MDTLCQKTALVYITAGKGLGRYMSAKLMKAVFNGNKTMMHADLTDMAD